MVLQRAFANTTTLRKATNVDAEKRFVAPRSIPNFKPVPFKQEKFLSIKSRTAENFLSTRKHILKRSTEIISRVAKIQQQQQGKEHTGEKGYLEPTFLTNKEKSIGSNDCHEEIFIGTPLTSHMVEEIDAWNTSLRNLEALQGFVLTDELVYSALSKNIRLGAFPYVLDWLRKAARERRIPIPAYVLGDVRIFFDFVLSVLPSSNASLMRVPETLLGMSPTVDTSVNVQPFIETDVDKNVSSQLVNSSPYVRYLVEEMYIPVWRCLLDLGLLPSVKNGSEADLRRLLQEQQHVNTVVDLIRRVCCCDYGNGDSDVRTPLQAYTGLLLSLAQCAAEAKEIYLLLELQLVFCTLFIEFQDESLSNSSGWRLRRSQWCYNKEDEEVLCHFANEFLATVFYGRLAYQGEMSLDRCVSYLYTSYNCEESDDNFDCKRDIILEDHEGDNEIETSSSLPPQPLKEKEEEKESDETSDSSLLNMTLQDAVDGLLRDLINNEETTFKDASMYAALVLEDTSLIPKGNARTEGIRFSDVEVTWMELHCELCCRCRLGENVMKELEEFFQPGGVVAQGIELSVSSVTDQQSFLALVVETVVTVAAASSVLAKERYMMTTRLIARLLSCLEEAQNSYREKGELLMLPHYSAACAMVLLSPLLYGTNSSNSLRNDDEKAEEVEDTTVISNEEVKRLLHGIMHSVLNQPISFGNVYSVVLVVLTRAEMWEMVLSVLHKIDTSESEDGVKHGISSVLVDQRVWAWLFRRARDAGQVDICLFLRQKRERLFY